MPWIRIPVIDTIAHTTYIDLIFFNAFFISIIINPKKAIRANTPLSTAISRYIL